jgi:hypothetical protein
MARTESSLVTVSRRRACGLLATAALLSGLLPSLPARALTPGSADRIGHWDDPFEEAAGPGAGCSSEGGTAECHPVAAAMAAMADGRTFYFNGVEAGAARSAAARLDTKTDRHGGARLLDLRSGSPQWAPAMALTATGTGTSSPSSADSAQNCGDLVQLADGRILLAGGHGRDALPDVVAVPTARILDPGTGSFRPAGQLRSQRWYAGLVVLANGTVVMAGGADRLPANGAAGSGQPTETYDPATNVWSETLAGPASQHSLPSEPRLFLTPNGKVLYLGAGQSVGPEPQSDAALWGLQQSFDPSTGRWEIVGPAPAGFRDGATSVMLPLHPPYGRATILTFGGLIGPGPGGGVGVPLSTLTTVDRSGLVSNRTTGETTFPRWFSSAVPLPDGTVLAVGGAGNAAPSRTAELPLREAELFIPGVQSVDEWHANGRWFRMASPVRQRGYHNSAVLLPDGRVLFGGGEADPSFEIFSPPYLYRGPRPTIRHAPAGVAWGETFPVVAPRALAIGSVVLMRLGSPQHVNDNDVRTLSLRFSRTNGNTLQVTAPPDGNVAPPGLYYLFLNGETQHGIVPSLARIVRVGPSGDPGEALQPFGGDPSGPPRP